MPSSGCDASVLDGAVVENRAMVAAGALVTPGKIVRSGEVAGWQSGKEDARSHGEDFETFEDVVDGYVARPALQGGRAPGSGVEACRTGLELRGMVHHNPHLEEAAEQPSRRMRHTGSRQVAAPQCPFCCRPWRRDPSDHASGRRSSLSSTPMGHALFPVSSWPVLRCVDRHFARFLRLRRRISNASTP